MVNCTTESTPEHPSHYIAVKRQEVKASIREDDAKDVNDWTKWWQQQRLLKQQDKDSTMEVLFVVRATKNEMDILTDALLEATPYRGGFSHQGLLKSAMWLFEEYKHWLPQLLDASGNTKMELYTVGYSLGAGKFVDYVCVLKWRKISKATMLTYRKSSIHFKLFPTILAS